MELTRGIVMANKTIQDKMNELIGTCETFDTEEFCDKHGIDEDLLCGTLDHHIFQCTACGWWVGIEEESSDKVGCTDWICEECAENE